MSRPRAVELHIIRFVLQRFVIVLLLVSAVLRKVGLGLPERLLAPARRQVRSLVNRKDSYASVRVIRDHQTEVYTPEEADHATHNGAPWDRDKGEIKQRH
jgi:hypothetical protein